jgi:hypothetical protein
MNETFHRLSPQKKRAQQKITKNIDGNRKQQNVIKAKNIQTPSAPLNHCNQTKVSQRTHKRRYRSVERRARAYSRLMFSI